MPSNKSASEKRRARIIDYLKKRLNMREPFYFHSREVAEALGLTPHEVGTNIRIIIEEGEKNIKIQKWAESHRAFTWRAEYTL
jgi:hypothetical protein